ncbi:MAG: hypothetical protein ACFFCE_14710 [Promethearchaeota archaeon]
METEIKDTIIKKCEIELSNKINKLIKKGFSVFDAIDEAFKEYKLDEEIIIKYEIEMVKKDNNDNKDLKIAPEQIDKLLDEIRKLVYNKFIN